MAKNEKSMLSVTREIKDCIKSGCQNGGALVLEWFLNTYRDKMIKIASMKHQLVSVSVNYFDDERAILSIKGADDIPHAIKFDISAIIPMEEVEDLLNYLLE